VFTGLATLGAVLVSYAYTWGLVPLSGEWLKNNIDQFDPSRKLSPEASEAMDQLIAGGHYFIFDGVDIWMRFKVTDGDSATRANLEAFIPDFSTDWQCDPTETAVIQRWFLKQLSHPTFGSRLTPWSDLNIADRLSLGDPNQLDCIAASRFPASSIAAPSTCNHWWLHSQKTGFIYVRFTCYT
jgi:hypothetical protein